MNWTNDELLSELSTISNTDRFETAYKEYDYLKNMMVSSLKERGVRKIPIENKIYDSNTTNAELAMLTLTEAGKMVAKTISKKYTSASIDFDMYDGEKKVFEDFKKVVKKFPKKVQYIVNNALDCYRTSHYENYLDIAISKLPKGYQIVSELFEKAKRTVVEDRFIVKDFKKDLNKFVQYFADKVDGTSQMDAYGLMVEEIKTAVNNLSISEGAKKELNETFENRNNFILASSYRHD